MRQIYDHTDAELATEWVAEIGRDFTMSSRCRNDGWEVGGETGEDFVGEAPLECADGASGGVARSTRPCTSW